MACLHFNAAQQKHHYTITLRKYIPSCDTLKFRCLPHFLTCSPPKHAPCFVVRTHVADIHAKLPTKDSESPFTKDLNLRDGKQRGSGRSSLRIRGKRVGRETIKNIVSSVLEEKTEKRFTRDRIATKDIGIWQRKKMRSKDGKKKIAPLETVENEKAGKMERKMKRKMKKDGDDRVKEEKFEQGSTKKKANLAEVQLRLGLDMCSKRGDVMGAIELYDFAVREGIKMGMYHYAVILYLCSSAAVGIVQPAKSGSVARPLNLKDVAGEVSNGDLVDSSELRRKSDTEIGDCHIDTRTSNNEQQLNDKRRNHGTVDKVGLNPNVTFDNMDGTLNGKKKLAQFCNGLTKLNSQDLDGSELLAKDNTSNDNHSGQDIHVSEDVKKYAIQRGLEIYEKMCMEKVPMNEATLTSLARIAMSTGNGDMAFDMVKQMKSIGVNPRLRSYGPALYAFCSGGDVDKAFAVEKHMLELGVYPGEPELEALLRVSVEAGKGDKVYYLLHKLRGSIRQVSTSTAAIIVRWFKSKAASKVGKRRWDPRLIKEATENGGGGWHGQGWLGKGKWTVSYTSVGADGLCKCCGEKLTTIDLDSTETENFARSVASIAIKRDKDLSFQKFQKWLDYYGPFEAVIDGANVGVFSQTRFMPSKINAVVNGIRQKLPSKKWPLIILHNKRVTGQKMDEPVNKALVEKWKNADALYATPTGSNDDWYWLYAAIKFKCLIVTNDEMRDHRFQLLGNDFFPKWKERHQVRITFTEASPVFHMPPSCSVVIQESEKGHWHIPIATDHGYEAKREWLCITRANSHAEPQDNNLSSPEESQLVDNSNRQARGYDNKQDSPKEAYKDLRNILAAYACPDNSTTVLSAIEAAEILGGCVIDFQI